MTTAQHTQTRRAFIKAGGTLLALPLLESLGMQRPLSAAVQTVTPAPKRMVFLGMGFGVTEESWYPDPSQIGEKYDMPKVLTPLAKHKNDLTIIQNLYHQYTVDGHFGSTFWLTGANRYAVAGQSFHNTISVDQVAAEQLGRETRFTSIQLSGSNLGNASDGHGPGLSLAWNRQGKPVASWQLPVVAYHRLFSDDSAPLAVRQQQLAEQRSVLDVVLTDAKSVQRRINKTDSDKLDEYFQSVREIEVRLAKEEKWMGVEKKKPQNPIREPAESLEGVEEMRIMYDLMVAAMQVDASRVFTYRMPGDTMLASLGANMSAHNMSHYAEGDRQEVSELRDRHHAILLSDFMDKLKASKSADGSTLFDNVTIAFGSNIRTKHSLTNCPTIVAGGGAGIQHGRHLVMDDRKTPLCNLWLSLLKGSGIEAEQFGDSRGVIDELFAA
ncbi:MAG TPA: DUF1552 domain-containing protein [Pirellulaceae bacterium]|nr:DUF1552 domain-containing protein [Pirellulaceae bacterium]